MADKVFSVWWKTIYFKKSRRLLLRKGLNGKKYQRNYLCRKECQKLKMKEYMKMIYQTVHRPQAAVEFRDAVYAQLDKGWMIG